MQLLFSEAWNQWGHKVGKFRLLHFESKLTLTKLSFCRFYSVENVLKWWIIQWHIIFMWSWAAAVSGGRGRLFQFDHSALSSWVVEGDVTEEDDGICFSDDDSTGKIMLYLTLKHFPILSSSEERGTTEGVRIGISFSANIITLILDLIFFLKYV